MENKLPNIQLIYNRYKKASKTKKAVVEVRITHNYKQKYISTGVWLYPNQWKNGKITNCEDILEISKTLEKVVSSIRQVIFEMLQEGKIDLFSIPERLKQKGLKQRTFIEYCQERAAIRKYGKGRDTQERYDRFLRLFSKWGRIQSFEGITDTNIITYDRFLTSQGMKAYSKWQNYHRFLNSFIMDAMEEGILTRNPYKWINIEKDSQSVGIEKFLTPDEFYKLKKATMPTESLERVKDLFIFQTYTCMSYTDLRMFDPEHITLVNGMQVYIGKRVKTQKPFTIPLLKPAIEVLQKYHNSLPVISNVKYNAYLKKVAKSAKIGKPLSTHWARHTGATLLLNEGVDMRIVSRICGHSSTKVTEQIYAKLLDETVVEAIQEIQKNLR